MKKSILLFVVAMMMLAGMANGQGAARAPRPTLTGPVADLLNKIVVAINTQDKAFLDKVVAPNATWADEDIHIFPAAFFINKLMQGMPRKLTITNVAGETWDTGAWAAYNYTLDETRADGTQHQLKGIQSMTFRKVGSDWQVVLFHNAIDPGTVTH